MTFARRSWIGIVAAVLAAVTCVGVSAPAGATPSSAPKRAATHTGAVPLTVPLLGALAPTTAVPVTLALQPRNTAGLQQRIAAEYAPGNPLYHHYLSAAEYRASYAPTAAQAQTVVNFLRSAGMTAVNVAPNRLLVTAQATAAQVTEAFGTPLVDFLWNGRHYFANSAAATVPSALGGLVTAVLGLTNLPVQTAASANRARAAQVGAGAFDLQDFAHVYDGAGLPAASGQAIAILGFGDMTQTVTDLRTAEQKDGLPQVPVSVVYVSGNSGDTSGADEWNMDTQTSTAIAGDVSRLVIYAGGGSSVDQLTGPVNRFASDDQVMAASASWGLCEAEAVLLGVKTAMEPALQEAMAQGQTLFVSSGDNGAACNPLPISTNGIPLAGLPATVSYPASSTYATAVGGTSLYANGSGGYGSESAWTAGGGGFALTSAPGPWVGNATSGGLGLLGTILKLIDGGRGVPDLAMDADPNTGANVWLDGAFTSIGGTSLSAPLALGAWARVQQAVGHQLGAAAPALYQLYRAHAAGQAPGLHDVTSGSIVLYPATTGWDAATGVGSIDMAGLAQALG